MNEPQPVVPGIVLNNCVPSVSIWSASGQCWPRLHPHYYAASLYKAVLPPPWQHRSAAKNSPLMPKKISIPRISTHESKNRHGCLSTSMKCSGTPRGCQVFVPVPGYFSYLPSIWLLHPFIAVIPLIGDNSRAINCSEPLLWSCLSA